MEGVPRKIEQLGTIKENNNIDKRSDPKTGPRTTNDSWDDGGQSGETKPTVVKSRAWLPYSVVHHHGSNIDWNIARNLFTASLRISECFKNVSLPFVNAFYQRLGRLYLPASGCDDRINGREFRLREGRSLSGVQFFPTQ